MSLPPRIVARKPFRQKVDELADFGGGIRPRRSNSMQRRGGGIGGMTGEHLDQPAPTDLYADQPFRDQDQAEAGTSGGNQRFPVVGEERTRGPDLGRFLPVAKPPRIAARVGAEREARMIREFFRPVRPSRSFKV